MRVLLCTLPDVLWEGHEWKLVSMADLDTPDKVKSCYRKYIVKYHPDRIMPTGDHEKIFLANRIFASMVDQFN